MGRTVTDTGVNEKANAGMGRDDGSTVVERDMLVVNASMNVTVGDSDSLRMFVLRVPMLMACAFETVSTEQLL